MKKCSKCKKKKNTNDFYNIKRSSDGKDSYCKICRDEDSKKYRERNKERIKQKNHEYKVKNGIIKKANKELLGKEIYPIYDLDNLKNEKGSIYLIKDLTFTNFIKIGKSKKPEIRKLNLINQLPFDIELEELFIKECENVNLIERILHQKFQSKRRKGEWFELNEKEIEQIIEFLSSENISNIINKKEELFSK